MKQIALALSLLAGCATPWLQVKDAKTIEEARKQLGSYTPSVTPYPPNAEAWYFGKNECVLFIDGKVRFSKSSWHWTERDGVRINAPAHQQEQVLCAPSQMASPP
ncbi:MAG: hypothetical protein Q8L48_22585 [Archangium sp.]|nr:hypothetical protein [Archangium sp.]